MNLAVLSVNFKTAPIEILEVLSCNKDDVTDYLSNSVGTIFFDEMVIVSTCNRTEWVFTAPDVDKAITVLKDQIKTKTNVAMSILDQHLVMYHKEAALLHLFEVVTGLKSMVVGENEILAQVKTNYSFCMEFGATGAYLNKLFQLLIATGKEARSVTHISKGSHSISSIAIEAIKLHDPDFLSKPMLLIGAGVMIQRALAKLSAMGHESICVVNRTMSRAESLMDVYPGISVVPYASLYKILDQFSTIYVGVHSNHPLFNVDHLKYLNGNKTLVDVGVPRSIEPECGGLNHIHLISIDQLESVANETIKNREAVIPHVHACIRVALSDFNQWLSYRNESIEWVNKRISA